MPQFFKDESFGVKPGDVERTYSPRADVTIQRDTASASPTSTATRSRARCSAPATPAPRTGCSSWTSSRNVGRGEPSSFAGGARARVDEDIFAGALQGGRPPAPVRTLDDLYGAEGRQVQEDIADYVAGVQAIHRRGADQPAEDAGRVRGDRPAARARRTDVRDVISTARLIGVLGKGGGSELDSALALQAARKRFGRKKGNAAWRDFRSAEDPEAPVTVLKKFPYQKPPKRVRKGSLALPDRGSVEKMKSIVRDGGAEPPRAPGGLQTGSKLGRPGAEHRRAPRRQSNALLVSGRESASGRPLAVFGPQTGYFNPQILMEIDLHGPGIDARGAASTATLRDARPRPRLRLERDLVEPGHHRHLRGRPLRAGRRAADQRLDALPLPRPLPADGA